MPQRIDMPGWMYPLLAAIMIATALWMNHYFEKRRAMSHGSRPAYTIDAGQAGRDIRGAEAPQGYLRRR